MFLIKGIRYPEAYSYLEFISNISNAVKIIL